MEGKSIRESFDIIRSRLSETELIILDFSFLMFMTSTEFLDMLSDFAYETQKKVLIGDDFSEFYEIVAESTSEEQRKIAEGAKFFVNDLRKKGLLFRTSKYPDTSALIKALSGNSKTAVFLARDSVADEALRSCMNAKAMVFACLSSGKVCCEKAEIYISKIIRAVDKSPDNNQALNPPEVPTEGTRVKTRDNTFITLGKLIDKGAEGAVYNTDKQDYVCKIYHKKQMTVGKCKKLSYFENRQVKYDGICWPEKIVYTESGFPVGYIMQKARGKNLADIFDGEDAILEEFPKWKKADIVRTAISIFKKIEYLHLLGIIVGDIRPQNIVIDRSGKTYLIDMDSCQIENFPCAFGDEDYTPAEYQGRAFSSFLRKYQGENFSCWTLCFFIMFLGQHPYAQKNGSDSIAEDIACHAFPYPATTNGSYSRVPEGEYRDIWKYLPTDMKSAFYDTFADDNRISCLKMISLLKDYYAYLKKLDPYDIGYEIVPIKKVENIWSGAGTQGTSIDIITVDPPPVKTSESRTRVPPGGLPPMVPPIVPPVDPEPVKESSSGKKFAKVLLIILLSIMLICLCIYLVALLMEWGTGGSPLETPLSPIQFLFDSLNI